MNQPHTSFILSPPSNTFESSSSVLLQRTNINTPQPTLVTLFHVPHIIPTSQPLQSSTASFSSSSSNLNFNQSSTLAYLENIEVPQSNHHSIHHSNNNISSFSTISNSLSSLSSTEVPLFDFSVDFTVTNQHSNYYGKEDNNKSSKSLKLINIPNIKYPIIFVEKGKLIDVNIETSPHINAMVTNGNEMVITFDCFTKKGHLEEPVYGQIDNMLESLESETTSNLCFIQATEPIKLKASYIKTNTGFFSLHVPFKQNPQIISIKFPFLNFKCATTTKKIVYFKISLCTYQTDLITQCLASKVFQLVSCTSPQRDYKRHYDKFHPSSLSPVLYSNSSSASSSITEFEFNGPLKKQKLMKQDETKEIVEEKNPQYIIMTENYEIWKILNMLNQELTKNFKSKK